MDAGALLRAQGWRGQGFSLHPSDDAVGLAKPLTLSGNSDGRGIGRPAHHTSDQWWLHAFDQKLKGLDTSGGTVVQSVKTGRLDAVGLRVGAGKHAGLYASFVRGDTIGGTIDDETTDATPEHQHGDAPAKTVETAEERGTRRAQRRIRKEGRRLRREERARRTASEAQGTRRKSDKTAVKPVESLQDAAQTKDQKRLRKLKKREAKR